MDDFKDKLNKLLEYWIEHNKEHGEEFREWADKAGSVKSGVSQLLQDAAGRMDEATDCLEKAKKALS